MDNSEKGEAQPFTIEELAAKLKVIQLNLEQNRANLKQQLDKFYSNPKFFGSMESFKAESQAHASNLEEEIKKLQKELKEVRNALGLDAEEGKRVGS
jgi:cytochrome c556